MASSTQTLLERFQKYCADNNDEAGRERYKSVAAQIEAIRSGEQNLTDNFLEELWTDRLLFGKLSASRAHCSKGEFPDLQHISSKITMMLISNPSPNTLVECMDICKASIGRSLSAVTHRVLVAAAPTVYPCIVSKDNLVTLKKHLNTTYSLSISGKTWEDLSAGVRTAVVAQGIPDNDPFLVNTFIEHLWRQAKADRTQKRGGNVEMNSKDDTAPEPGIDKPEALNTIYYGPPGTGKTYQVRQILKEHYESRYEGVSQEEWMADLVREEKWSTVVAASLADRGKATASDLMKHPLIIAKYACMGGKEQKGGRVNNTLKQHAPADSPTLQYERKGIPPILFIHETGGGWHLVDAWEDNAPDATVLLKEFKAGKPSSAENKKRYKCITFHQSYSYEDFVEGIRPVLHNEDQNEQEGSVSYALHDGIFKRICSEARNDPAHDYALLIDEINRGNISKIFGELITLLEDSKREGAAEEIKVTLPYSGQSFGIPKNLYVIGTMNTADRSLALLDTALRRRFSFQRVDPEPELLADKVIDDVEVDRLLTEMNERIAALYDQDHMIGHSYFWNVQSLADLKNVFLKNIFPLLEEYFFDDWEKIRLVLGDVQKTHQNKREYCLLQREERKKNLFGDGEYSGSLVPRWTYIEEALDNRDSYIGIYDLSKLMR